MGLKVITDDKPVVVYRQDKTSSNGAAYTQYSIGVSSKNASGEWVNGFIECQFKKGVNIANKSKISISNSFYTVTEYNGKKYYKLFIMDFNVVEDGNGFTPAPNNNSNPFVDIDASITQEELPFA